MSPKRSGSIDGFPACDELFSELQKLGGGMTQDNLKKIDGKVRARAYAALHEAKLSDPQLNADLQAAKGHAGARAILLKFVIDVHDAKMKAVNTTTVETSTSGRMREIWLTESQLASATWLNSEADAKTAVKSCQSQLHKENAAMAAAGIKQYQWFYVVKDQLKKETDSATIEKSVDLDAEQYAAIKTEMLEKTFEDGASIAREAAVQHVELPRHTAETTADKAAEAPGEGEPHTKKQRKNKGQGGKPRDDKLTAEEQERHDVTKALDQAISSLSSLHNKMRNEMGKVGIIKLRLKARTRWGGGALEYLEEETTRWEAEAKKVEQMWAEELAWKTDQAYEKETFLTKTKEIEEFKEAKETEYVKDYVQGVLGEFANMKR